jgi:hypothetical protein
MKLGEFSGKKGSVSESKMSELDLDLKDNKMSDKEFKAKYKKTKQEVKAVVKPVKKVKEATGDARFDGMMNNITNNTEPSAQLGSKMTTPNREIRDLTHEIFLKLRDYDDPEIYQKFIDMMIKTINNPNVGPLDESRKR